MTTKKIHAVVVRRIETYRTVVETRSSADRYAKQDAARYAIARVRRNRDEDLPEGGVEFLGEVFETEILMSGEVAE